MAKAVLPFCAASVLLHALPLTLSLEQNSLRDLPATRSELLLLPPEPRGEREATAERATEALAAAAPAAPAPLRAPRERVERALAPSAPAPSVAAPSVAVAAAPSVVEPTSERSVAAAPAADPPAEETGGAGEAAGSGDPAASSQWVEAPRVASGGSVAAAPSVLTSGARESTPGSVAEDPVAARARYLRALRQRVLERREYPYPAQRAGLQGTVCLRLSVDAAGRLSELRATCGPSPQPLLEAALRAVRAAEPFGPLPSGLGNQLTIDLPVVFRLDAP